MNDKSHHTDPVFLFFFCPFKANVWIRWQSQGPVPLAFVIDCNLAVHFNRIAAFRGFACRGEVNPWGGFTYSQDWQSVITQKRSPQVCSPRINCVSAFSDV